MKPAKNIIIAEDNRADVELFKFCMSESPFNVELIHFLEGKSLIEYTKSMVLENIAFILLDMHLPGLDGFEILSQLKAQPQLKDLPVITVSSFPGQSFYLKCIAHGATEHYLKPAALDQYEEMVNQILDRWCQEDVVKGASRS